MESFRINLIFIVFYDAYYTFWLSLTNQEYPPLNASQTAYRSNAFSMTPRLIFDWVSEVFVVVLSKPRVVISLN